MWFELLKINVDEWGDLSSQERADKWPKLPASEKRELGHELARISDPLGPESGREENIPRKWTKSILDGVQPETPIQQNPEVLAKEYRQNFIKAFSAVASVTPLLKLYANHDKINTDKLLKSAKMLEDLGILLWEIIKEHER